MTITTGTQLNNKKTVLNISSIMNHLKTANCTLCQYITQNLTPFGLNYIYYPNNIIKAGCLAENTNFGDI